MSESINITCHNLKTIINEVIKQQKRKGKSGRGKRIASENKKLKKGSICTFHNKNKVKY